MAFTPQPEITHMAPLRSRRGFTLVESLVTLVVLGLLVALLYSGLSASRRQALNARSLHNLKQIGVALHSYISDHNGQILPRVYHTAAARPKGDQSYWTATLYLKGYLQDKKAFYDPRVPPYGPQSTDVVQRRDIETSTPATYGMRDWVKPGEMITSFTARVLKPITAVETPSDFFIVADSYWIVWQTPGYGISPGANGDNRVRIDPQGNAGALFLDGHVALKPAAYFEALQQTQGQYSAGQPIPVWRP